MTRLFLALAIFLATAATVMAQDYPSVEPTATYVTTDGEMTDAPSEPLSSPVMGFFKANPENLGDYVPTYNWKIWFGSPNTVPVLRNTENFEYMFTQSGTYFIQLYASFIQEGDTIMWPEEGEAEPLMVTVAMSKLEFPNAFSPNGDGYNDVYKAKEGYKSIISFEATIFNRWGVRLYSWNDLSGGWDGRYNGKVVPDGVYYVVVKAKGADGIDYNIRRDVNVLTGTKSNGQDGKTR